MDDADRATDCEEAAWADLERRIAAARECQTKTPRSHCQDWVRPWRSIAWLMACVWSAPRGRRLGSGCGGTGDARHAD